MGAIKKLTGAFQQRFGRVQANAKLAEAVQGQWIVHGFFDTGINPWPGASADEVQGVLIGRAGDAGVDGRMKNLCQRAYGSWAFEGSLKRHHVIGADKHVIEHHRAAAGGALAEAAPVIDHRQARSVTRDEGQLLHTLFVHHRGRYALRIQGAGRVKLAAVDAIAITVLGQARSAVVSGSGAQLGQCVTEALPG